MLTAAGVIGNPTAVEAVKEAAVPLHRWIGIVVPHIVVTIPMPSSAAKVPDGELVRLLAEG